MFKQLEVTPEKWKPADCLLSWWHVAQFFAGDGTRDLMVWHSRLHPQPGQPAPPQPSASWADDNAAVVQRRDVSEGWVRELEQFCSAHGLSEPKRGNTNDMLKFSHAWVVGGKKTTTGSAVLVSDPQTPVRNPSLWMEFHVRGKRFDVRGIGMPGSPGLLIGFNRQVAWGLTALGADQADLFRLETSAEHPYGYRWNAQWRKMEVRTDRILVRGGEPMVLTIRETHLGPVVLEFAFRQPGDPEVALKRVPVSQSNRDTIQAVFAMMRARNAKVFQQALARWDFPSANCVYGDKDGHIGFGIVGAIPIRPRSAADAGGGEALPGSGDEDDWQGFVPPRLVPQVQDPGAGFLLSANHRPIGPFYPVPLGTSTGSIGDTIRSWRLRELLSGKERFSPREVLDVHYDTVNPARREIVRLGLQIRNNQPGALSDEALKALAALERWLEAGASSDLNSRNAELAAKLSTFFRFVVTPLAGPQVRRRRIRSGSLSERRLCENGQRSQGEIRRRRMRIHRPGLVRSLGCRGLNGNVQPKFAWARNPDWTAKTSARLVRQPRWTWLAGSGTGPSAAGHHLFGWPDHPLPIVAVLHAMGAPGGC
jgi:acyl-homoserine lactone acylase PvdQ